MCRKRRQQDSELHFLLSSSSSFPNGEEHKEERGVEAEEIPCLKRSNPLSPLFLAGWLAWQPAEEEGDEGERKRRRKAVGGGKGGPKIGSWQRNRRQKKPTKTRTNSFHNHSTTSRKQANKKTHKSQLFSPVTLFNPIVSPRTTQKRFRKKVE